MERCPRCGAPLREGEGFCPNCGVPLGPNAPRRRRKVAVIAVVVVIITCLIVVATVGVLFWRRAGSTAAPSAEVTKSAPVQDLDVGATDEVEAAPVPVLEEAQSYVANYLWQAGPTVNNVPGFRCVVDGIPEGAVLGVHLADYDGDGELERLVVRWQGGTVVLEVQESDGTSLTQIAVVGENGTWPLGNEGRLEVLADDAGTIVAQWASGPLGIGDGIFWTLVRYGLGAQGFFEVGRAYEAGSYVESLTNLKSQIEGLGLPVDAIADDNPSGSLDLMYSYCDDALDVVCRIDATSDSFDYHAAADAIEGATEWSEMHPMGTVTVTQPE